LPRGARSAGYNTSLFAYGQTGAGKSYSMVGYGEDKGIIPIASEKIFDNIRANTDPDLSFKVESSMLEIYMEKVRDLFNPKVSYPWKPCQCY
jgi:kinesin family protein 1